MDSIKEIRRILSDFTIPSLNFGNLIGIDCPIDNCIGSVGFDENWLKLTGQDLLNKGYKINEDIGCSICNFRFKFKEKFYELGLHTKCIVVIGCCLFDERYKSKELRSCMTGKIISTKYKKIKFK